MGVGNYLTGFETGVVAVVVILLAAAIVSVMSCTPRAGFSFQTCAGVQDGGNFREGLLRVAPSGQEWRPFLAQPAQPAPRAASPWSEPPHPGDESQVLCVSTEADAAHH